MTELVTDGVDFWAFRTPDHPAIVFDGHDIVDYAALRRWTDAAGHHLVSLGLCAGERVGVMGANSLEWVIAAIGALKIGAIVVPLNNRFTGEEVRVLIEDTSPHLVLADEDSRSAAESAVAGTCSVVVSLEGFTALRHDTPTPLPRLAEANPDDITQIVYTSGTASRPKGVIFTHRSTFNLIADLAINEPSFRAGGRILYTLSMSGAPGLLWHFVNPLTRGMTVYYERRFDAADALARITDFKIEIFAGVPLLFERIAALPEFADADLSSLRLVTVGGAPAPVSMIKVWLEKGVTLRQAYGMTELGGLPTFNPADQAVARPHSIGAGGVHTRIRVIRPDGSDCAPNEPGEVIVSGPTVTPGYWRNQQAYDEAFRNGWFHTGDVGVMDDEGWIQIIDRLKDIIITGGYNVAPSEIEAAIAEIQGILDVCVIAAQDPKFGESPAAVVHAERAITAAEIIEHCRQRLAGYKIPKHVVIDAEPLPRLVSGKIARRQIRDRFPEFSGSAQPTD